MEENFKDQENIQEQETENTENKENNKQDCCAELQQIKAKYLYTIAEFDNYKKRTDREKTQWINHGQVSVLTDLLDIVDDFKRTFDQLEKQQLPVEVKSYFEGFKLISKSLQKFLSKYNIQEIKADNFDPELHEAVMQVESPNHKSGDIVQLLQAGYQYKDQVLRPAKVSVAK